MLTTPEAKSSPRTKVLETDNELVSSPDRYMLRHLYAGERGGCFKACSAAP